MIETAVFGGGCFWCTEAVFKTIKGVVSVVPGYAGGTSKNPSYSNIHVQGGDHAEVVRIEFDPTQVSYHNLLTVFFATHDATQVNRQGYDIGREYRSLVLYSTEAQKNEAASFINDLNASNVEGDVVATELKPLTEFYQAEPEHIDFYTKNKDSRYCEIIIAPKLQKVQESFAELLANNRR